MESGRPRTSKEARGAPAQDIESRRPLSKTPDGGAKSGPRITPHTAPSTLSSNLLRFRTGSVARQGKRPWPYLAVPSSGVVCINSCCSDHKQHFYQHVTSRSCLPEVRDERLLHSGTPDRLCNSHGKFTQLWIMIIWPSRRRWSANWSLQ